LHSPGTPRRNKSSQWLARQPSHGEIDDIRIAEEVIEEGFDRFETVRPPQLKENYSYPASAFFLYWTHFMPLDPAL
jgi:hypothetical protein